mmetsp:Transcript_1050/g.1737  ORF Transcript_1050/g.1737 Transcript_1050/m.1737 type:complete len:235 (+) Transcript_1050:1013-1717(+)
MRKKHQKCPLVVSTNVIRGRKERAQQGTVSGVVVLALPCVDAHIRRRLVFHGRIRQVKTAEYAFVRSNDHIDSILLHKRLGKIRSEAYTGSTWVQITAGFVSGVGPQGIALQLFHELCARILRPKSTDVLGVGYGRLDVIIRSVDFVQFFDVNIGGMKQPSMHDKYRLIHHGKQRQEIEDLRKHFKQQLVIFLFHFCFEAIDATHRQIFVIATVQTNHSVSFCHKECEEDYYNF